MTRLARAPDLLTVAEVADELRLDRQTVYKRIQAGTLPAVRVTERAVRVPRDDLRAWLDSRRTDGEPAP